ncbi:FkbM family methyltransferase [Comamonas endophytica]|uniref:FkbM family methyltransferase n=1 Tax=Comamonas endophytica TaxID=2949090 RepID=A0ABY6GAQ6_9BURK|nr:MULTISPECIES: FkbM family methyltransferase [unclassified Acidovorax]MCD2511914.1 FkbM family methyltransferase [Acidovorax sp. D4N7]UYG51632.1 FkbM family methyltransferase [Acidovorax sp. 5MLIR]
MLPTAGAPKSTISTAKYADVDVDGARMEGVCGAQARAVVTRPGAQRFSYSKRVKLMQKLSDIEGLIRKSGNVSFDVAGTSISFDLSNRHERAYAARLLLDVCHPQADIDLFLFQHFLRPSDTVLDAGANIGMTALECLEAGAGKVVAVEALPVLYERLKKLNPPGLIAVNKAISSSPGKADFYISTAHNQGSSLNSEMIGIFPSVFGEVVKKTEVELTTIDELVESFGAFDVWKLDIEGAELDAVRGAQKTLGKCPPRIVIVELYDDFYDDFRSGMIDSHPFVGRAFLSIDGYELKILPPVKGFPEGYHVTSPMYVFSRFPLE